MLSCLNELNSLVVPYCEKLSVLAFTVIWDDFLPTTLRDLFWNALLLFQEDVH